MNVSFSRIQQLVSLIPCGKVATYGQIALWAGNPRGARTVVWAMRAAPSDLRLPCHRVVNRSGALAPDHVFGGQAYQRFLLAGEGVPFRPDGRIDLRRCLWDGPL
jgi:methylated-DNA-protein-cysteine methyltransferase-like protein